MPKTTNDLSGVCMPAHGVNTQPSWSSASCTHVDGEAPEQELRHFTLSAAHHGQRLDKVLVELVPEFSRSYLQTIVAEGGVQLNGRTITKASSRAQLGHTLQVLLRQSEQSHSFRPESIALDVRHEDAHLLIVMKPAGMVVHPAPGNWSGTLLNALLAHHKAAAELPRAGIVHRLDKDTSGLMVVAKTRACMDALVALIAERAVSRQYLAIAHGSWTHSPIYSPSQPLLNTPAHSINAAIGRDPRNRLRMAAFASDAPQAKPARTDIRALASTATHCLVHCKLHTGRTHQIRVHMRHAGHPLLGDALYGASMEGELMPRQALHAWQLGFEHPITGQALLLQAAPPADFVHAATQLGLRAGLEVVP